MYASTEIAVAADHRCGTKRARVRLLDEKGFMPPGATNGIVQAERSVRDIGGTHPSVPDGSITTAGEGIPHHLTTLLTQNDGIIRAHWLLIYRGSMPSATQVTVLSAQPTGRGRCQ
jgi:hypothetical protein